MRLFRHGTPGQEKPGIFIENEHFDLSGVIEDFNESFFALGGLQNLQEMFTSNQVVLPKLVDGFRFGSCVARPSKIICIGLNYKDHALEAGMGIPSEPIVFLKSTTSLVGPNDTVIIPKDSQKTDWEAELAFVINKKASYVTEAEAMNYVAGFTIMNDISEREFQLERGGTWDKGKGCDTFGPLGPYLVTNDEAGEVENLKIWLKLNGTLLQNSNTEQLIFGIPFIVSYVSQFMTLLPGDVITTGTPPGVGMGQKPQFYLKEGDVMELGIEGLGVQKQSVIAYK